MLAAEPDQSSI